MVNTKNKTAKLNIDQALNFFRIIERNRKIMAKKYDGQVKTEDQWKKEFKNQGIDF